MPLTPDQIQQLWYAQQKRNNPRYGLMTSTQQMAFNANLDVIWSETSNYIIARYTDGNINFGITPSAVVTVTMPTFVPTISLNIGVDASAKPIMQTVKSSNAVFVSEIDNGGATNAYNFYSGDNVDGNGSSSLNINGLIESWEYDDDPLKMTSIRLNVRSKGDMTTWNPLFPDQFAPNKYFLVGTNTWISKLDPTQSIIWINSKPTANNLMPLDIGLNSGKYDPAHPELINSGWNLQSHTGSQWIWEFNYSDSSYVIKITLNGGSYKHTFNGLYLTVNDWYKLFIGTNINTP